MSITTDKQAWEVCYDCGGEHIPHTKIVQLASGAVICDQCMWYGRWKKDPQAEPMPTPNNATAANEERRQAAAAYWKETWKHSVWID